MLVIRSLLLLFFPQEKLISVCGCASTMVPVFFECVCKREIETKNLPSFRNTLMYSCCLCLYERPIERLTQAGSNPLWVSDSTSQA